MNDFDAHGAGLDFDMDGFARRLAEAMAPEKPTAFAQRLGLPHGTVSKYLRAGGTTGPRLDIVARMVEGLENTSLDWLVFGRGEASDTGDVIRVARYDATLAAGAGSWNEGRRRVGDMPFSRDFFLKRLGRPSGAGFSVLEAAGDSMLTTIHDGDPLLVDENDNRITDGVFAFVLDGEARVKRFRRTLSGLTIISDNPVYPTEELPTDQLDRISIIGRVRWVGQVI